MSKVIKGKELVNLIDDIVRNENYETLAEKYKISVDTVKNWEKRLKGDEVIGDRARKWIEEAHLSSLFPKENKLAISEPSTDSIDETIHLLRLEIKKIEDTIHILEELKQKY